MAKDSDNEARDESAEKRKDRRVGLYCHVKLSSTNKNAIDVVAGDISKGGIFLSSDQPLPEGQKVSLSFDTKQGHIKIDEGEVCWNKDCNNENEPGMGVKFLKIQPDSQKNIEDLIDEVLAEEIPIQKEIQRVPSSFVPDYKSVESKQPLANIFKETKQPQKVNKTRIIGIVGLALAFIAAAIMVLLWRNPIDKPPEAFVEPQVKTTRLADPNGRRPAGSVDELVDTSQMNEAKTLVVDEKKSLGTVANSPSEAQVVKPEKKTNRSSELKPIPQPTFEKNESSWRMILHIGKMYHAHHFTMTNPPRLIVDVAETEWANRTMKKPSVPFINQVRFGQQPRSARLVLDFKGKMVPKHKIARSEKTLVIHFVGQDENTDEPHNIDQ